MGGEVRLGQPQTVRDRGVRRVMRGGAVCLLVLVTSAAICVSIGVTRWGPFTLVGPGYAGPVRVGDQRLAVSSGWRRTVDVPQRDGTFTVPLPGDPAYFEFPAGYDLVTGDIRPQDEVTIHYQFGFVLMTHDLIEIGPAPVASTNHP